MAAILRLVGLPYRLSEKELTDFFDDSASVTPKATHLLLDRKGRPSGVGYVEFDSEKDANAVQEMCDGKNIGSTGRYAKMLKSDADELEWQLQRQTLLNGSDDSELFCVRMYGLPYKLSEYQVAKWFLEVDAKCVDVQIHLNHDSKPSGDATAYFRTLDEAKKAMDKDKADMSGRYINLSMDSAAATFNGVDRSGSTLSLRMSGLPFRATEREMRDFFKPIEVKSIRVILNMDGRPSGEAIASFANEDDMAEALKKDREHLGTRFIVLTKMDDDSNDGGGGGRGGRGGRNPNSGSSGGGGGGRFSLRMGGLPYRTSVDEIIDWFEPVAECQFVRILKKGGRPSGEAIAEFDTEDEARAALKKNKEYLGDRFIILTPQGF